MNFARLKCYISSLIQTKKRPEESSTLSSGRKCFVYLYLHLFKKNARKFRVYFLEYYRQIYFSQLCCLPEECFCGGRDIFGYKIGHRFKRRSKQLCQIGIRNLRVKLRCSNSREPIMSDLEKVHNKHYDVFHHFKSHPFKVLIFFSYQTQHSNSMRHPLASSQPGQKRT